MPWNSGYQVSDIAAIRAADARERASALGQEQGVELPEDVWGVVRQAEGAKQGAAKA